MRLVKETILENLRRFLIEILVIVGLSLNHAAVNLASFLWKIEISYYLVVVSLFTLIFSIYIRNLEKCVFYVLISIITGLIISAGILLMPPAIYGSDYMISGFSIVSYVTFISRYLIFNIVTCLSTAILGGLLSEGI